MKPTTIKAAFDQGYAEAECGRELAAWPSPQDFENRDKFTDAFIKGWTVGQEHRGRTIPAWVDDGDYQRSDAAPGL